ncbi:metallophosphoesterase [Pseudoalteromonas mariniglutinosa]|uniref:metallophosphoesterase n=1 Tax=Pseudoalteromonas mariniglutinosa TaxID=206042 RepID=UPI00384B4D9C
MRINANAILQAPTHRELQIDNDKRVFVIGDLDADFMKFQSALKSVNFDVKNDQLISLGDVIDRGNDSLKLLNIFAELGIHMVLGNHEHMMLESLLANDQQARDLWVKNGGDWHIHVKPETLKLSCEKLLTNPLSILLSYQNEKIGLSHTLPQQWHWQHMIVDKHQCVADLLWDRKTVKQKQLFTNEGVLFSVHGHNATANPFWIANSYHIDTNYRGGYPTIVELSTLIKEFKHKRVSSTWY